MISTKEKIDSLLFERAPWLNSNKVGIKIIMPILAFILGYKKTLGTIDQIKVLPANTLMEKLAKVFIGKIKITGHSNIQSNGSQIFVCNHPTGIADGLVIWSTLSKKRPDIFFFANKDVTDLLPQMQNIIAPVEWKHNKRTLRSKKETLAYAKKAFEAKRSAVIFPSGRLAQRTGLKLKERPWFTSAVKLASKYDIPLIPINIKARNSFLFYLFDFIHYTLRDITLFNEVLNKKYFTFEVEIKEKVYPKDLPKDFDQATMFLYKLATVSESNPLSSLPDKHQLYNNGDHLQRHMHPSNRLR